MSRMGIQMWYVLADITDVRVQYSDQILTGNLTVEGETFNNLF